jgi:hypothetical protein
VRQSHEGALPQRRQKRSSAFSLEALFAIFSREPSFLFWTLYRGLRPYPKIQALLSFYHLSNWAQCYLCIVNSFPFVWKEHSMFFIVDFDVEIANAYFLSFLLSCLCAASKHSLGAGLEPRFLLFGAACRKSHGFL